jgi:hypothetical protein
MTELEMWVCAAAMALYSLSSQPRTGLRWIRSARAGKWTTFE